MWDQKTGNIIPRLPPRKQHMPKSSISNVILRQNSMAKNALELTLSNLRSQHQWASRSLEGSRQAFIFRKLMQEETQSLCGLGHVSLLPQEVARSHQGLLTHRTRRSQQQHQHQHQQQQHHHHHHHHHHLHQQEEGRNLTDLALAYRMHNAESQGTHAPELMAEMRELAARRHGLQQKRHLEALHHKKERFFDSISDGFLSLADTTPRLTVTPEHGFAAPPTHRTLPPARAYNMYQNRRRLGATKLMTLPSIVTPKVFSEKEPEKNTGIFRQTTWRQEGSWQ